MFWSLLWAHWDWNGTCTSTIAITNAVPQSMDVSSEHEGLGITHPSKQLAFSNAVEKLRNRHLDPWSWSRLTWRRCFAISSSQNYKWLKPLVQITSWRTPGIPAGRSWFFQSDPSSGSLKGAALHGIDVGHEIAITVGHLQLLWGIQIDVICGRSWDENQEIVQHQI